MYDEKHSAGGRQEHITRLDDVQNDFGKRELLSQLNPADGHAETMVAILACMNMAGDCFAPAVCCSLVESQHVVHSLTDKLLHEMNGNRTEREHLSRTALMCSKCSLLIKKHNSYR